MPFNLLIKNQSCVNLYLQFVIFNGGKSDRLLDSFFYFVVVGTPEEMNLNKPVIPDIVNSKE